MHTTCRVQVVTGRFSVLYDDYGVTANIFTVEGAFPLTVFICAWYKTHAFMEPGYLLLHWQFVQDMTASIHT